MRPERVFSQRFLRKGPLVEETYRLFADWNDSGSFADNFHRLLHGQFPTLSWENEVRATISGRLKNAEDVRPLIVLARGSMKLDDWRDCWRLWIGATEEPFGGFVRDWLFPEYVSGRYRFRSADVAEYAVKAWAAHSPKRPLSDHGITRAARDLIHTASQLGMLSGSGPSKTFAAHSFSDDVLLFYVQMIADLEGSPAKVPSSPLWRLALMPASEAHVALLHLHQFRRLDYQIAGSLVQLALPFQSSLVLAESLAWRVKPMKASFARHFTSSGKPSALSTAACACAKASASSPVIMVGMDVRRASGRR